MANQVTPIVTTKFASKTLERMLFFSVALLFPVQVLTTTITHQTSRITFHAFHLRDDFSSKSRVYKIMSYVPDGFLTGVLRCREPQDRGRCQNVKGSCPQWICPFFCLHSPLLHSAPGKLSPNKPQITALRSLAPLALDCNLYRHPAISQR